MTVNFMPVLLAGFLAATASTAYADQYVVTVNNPVSGLSDALYASVNVTPLDAVEIRGVHYFVLEAPSIVHVETLFSVYGEWPVELRQLNGEWNSDAFLNMSLENRMNYAELIHCRFCLG